VDETILNARCHGNSDNNNSKESRSQRRKCFAGETTPLLLRIIGVGRR